MSKRNLNTISVSLSTSVLQYEKFVEIPTDMLLLEDTLEGTLCWVAGRPRSEKFLFRKYKHKGSPMFPYGGYILWDEKNQQEYFCYFDCAVIHPDVFKKPRKKSAKKQTTKKSATKTASESVKKKSAKKTTKKKPTRKLAKRTKKS